MVHRLGRWPRRHRECFEKGRQRHALGAGSRDQLSDATGPGLWMFDAFFRLAECHFYFVGSLSLMGSRLRKHQTMQLVKVIKSMPDEIQLLQKAKELAGQITAAEQSTVTIFAALLIADAIRSSVGQLTQMLSEKGE
jgi:hypothetical protein